MHNIGQELQEKTKQREAQRKRLLQAQLDRDADAPAFEQIKQFGLYASAITTLLAGQSHLPGQAEMIGILTSAVAQLQEAFKAAEAQDLDSPMDGTTAPAATEFGHAGMRVQPADLEAPTMPLGRPSGQAFAFPAQVPQVFAPPGLCHETPFLFGAAPPPLPPAATLVAGQPLAPL